MAPAIYVGFLLLLTPFLAQATHSEGVAGILEALAAVAPFLGVLVLIGAVASQLSAAVADTIGSGGLAAEVSGGRIGSRMGAVAASGLSILVVWPTDPLQVVAVASCAFAVYYIWCRAERAHPRPWLAPRLSRSDCYVFPQHWLARRLNDSGR